jgi:pentatricopeptide repeat protein
MGCCGICFLLFLPHFRQIPTQPGDPKHRSADAAMRCLYFRPNPTPPRPHSHHTHFAHLNACASRVHLAELHGRFVRGRLASNPAVAGRLVAMLAPHDAHYARRVLDRMPHPSAPAWNCVIRGHSGRGAPADALATFRDMLRKGVAPDGYTVAALVSASAALCLVHRGCCPRDGSEDWVRNGSVRHVRSG